MPVRRGRFCFKVANCDLEKRVGIHDEAIRTLFDAIRQMMKPERRGRKSIGFKVEEGEAGYV